MFLFPRRIPGTLVSLLTGFVSFAVTLPAVSTEMRLDKYRLYQDDIDKADGVFIGIPRPLKQTAVGRSAWVREIQFEILANIKGETDEFFYDRGTLNTYNNGVDNYRPIRFKLGSPYVVAYQNSRYGNPLRILGHHAISDIGIERLPDKLETGNLLPFIRKDLAWNRAAGSPPQFYSFGSSFSVWYSCRCEDCEPLRVRMTIDDGGAVTCLQFLNSPTSAECETVLAADLASSTLVPGSTDDGSLIISASYSMELEAPYANVSPLVRTEIACEGGGID